MKPTETYEQLLKRFNKSRTRKPLTPEQRKKIRDSFIPQREILQRAFAKRGKPKTTRGVAIPLKQAPKKPTGRGRRFTTTARIPSTSKKRSR